MEELLYAGGDLAFRSDSAALAIVRRRENLYRVIDIVELKPEKGRPLSPRGVCQTFASQLARFGIDRIALDGHYIESAREHFSPTGIVIVDAPSTQDGKASTYLTLRDIIHERRITAPANARLRMQLKQIRRKALAGGGLQISAPRRAGIGHGDLVSALVLACWQAAGAHRSFYESMTRIMDSGAIGRGGRRQRATDDEEEAWDQ